MPCESRTPESGANSRLEPGKSRPFEGVSVLSLAEQYPGPYATLLLADLGADVVLVERPTTGDPARQFPGFFASLARNKRSICLDLKSPEGCESLAELALKADIFLEGFRPGTMERLGFGYEALKARNPRLIYVSISGFGQSGAYKNRLAHDFSYQAVSGLLFDREGTRAAPPAVSYADLSGAMFAAFAVATALYARAKTGLGTFIDISIADGLASWMTAYLGPAMNGVESFSVHGEPAYGAFVCSDRRVLTLSIAHEDHFWRSLCTLLGIGSVAALEHTERVRRSEELKALLQSNIGLRTLDYWSAAFDRASIPWSPLNGLEAVIRDPHFRDRGLFASVSRADGSHEMHVGQPVQFSNYLSDIRKPAPRLGSIPKRYSESCDRCVA